jgi:hypothetical protein
MTGEGSNALGYLWLGILAKDSLIIVDPIGRSYDTSY